MCRAWWFVSLGATLILVAESDVLLSDPSKNGTLPVECHHSLLFGESIQ